MKRHLLRDYHIPALCLAVLLVTDATMANVLEEVIVTAQKRQTNLQKTALSVSALSGDELTNRQITDISGVALAVPNMNFG